MNKLSKYNYEIECNDRMIYFNGISGFLFSVSRSEHNFFQEQMADLISFEIQYNSLFNKLKEWCFILDSNVDELDIIRYRNRNAVFLDKSYRLLINPTLDCNFNCWYCLQNHPKGRMSDATLEKVKRHINYMITEEKVSSIFLNWFGGEPLLYFDDIIYPIAKYAEYEAKKNNINFTHNVTTNASVIDENMVFKMNEIGLKSFQITIDGDEKRHNKIRNIQGKPTFEKIMYNIDLLCRNIDDLHINLRINYDDNTLNKSEIYSVFEKIDSSYRSKITPMFVRVWQTQKKDMPTNSKRIELYRQCSDLGYQMCLPGFGFTLGQGVHCYADRYFHAELNYDGSVFKCTAKGHAKEHEAGLLLDDGRIEWKNSKINKMYAHATFENKMRLLCKHLPICMGPCSQNIIETKEEDLDKICVLNFSEMSPDAFIVSLFEKQMKNSLIV